MIRVRQFWFVVLVDNQIVTKEFARASCSADSNEQEILQACWRKAEELAWCVADQALSPKSPITRSRVSWRLINPMGQLIDMGCPEAIARTAVDRPAA